MKAGLLVVVALCLALCSLGMQAADAPAEVGSIIGIVVDSSGKPAKGCIVTAQENAQKMRPSVQGTTDAEGKFNLEKVAPGDYNLNARSPDVKSKAIKSVTVVAGKVSDTGKLTLKP